MLADRFEGRAVFALLMIIVAVDFRICRERYPFSRTQFFLKIPVR